MNRTARNFQLLTEIAALAAAPAIMIAGFVMFGTFAAAQFRIYNLQVDYAAGVGMALALLALIYFWPVPAAHRRVLLLLWLVRTGATLRIMLVFVPGCRSTHPCGSGLAVISLRPDDPVGAAPWERSERLRFSA